MDKKTEEIVELYERDIDRLIAEIEQLREEKLWMKMPGIDNSCGVLIQHIIGNLRHFIGGELGGTGYERDREREFTVTGVPAASLIKEARELKEMIFHVFQEIDEQRMEGDYPGNFHMEGSTRKILLHLYGHLNYHMGQLNYLRRILSENKG